MFQTFNDKLSEKWVTVKQGHPKAMDQGKGCPVLIEFLVNSKIYILNT